MTFAVIAEIRLTDDLISPSRAVAVPDREPALDQRSLFVEKLFAYLL
jgi:hypothetical protein